MAEIQRWSIAPCERGECCDADMNHDAFGTYVEAHDYETLQIAFFAAQDERDKWQATLRAILTAYDALNAEPSTGDTAKRAAFVAAVDAARGCV